MVRLETILFGDRP